MIWVALLLLRNFSYYSRGKSKSIIFSMKSVCLSCQTWVANPPPPQRERVSQTWTRVYAEVEQAYVCSRTTTKLNVFERIAGKVRLWAWNINGLARHAIAWARLFRKPKEEVRETAESAFCSAVTHHSVTCWNASSLWLCLRNKHQGQVCVLLRYGMPFKGICSKQR